MNYEATLADVANAMHEPSTPREISKHELVQRLHGILSELDDVLAMANRPETIELVNDESLLLGRINTRVQLILSFLLARQPLTLRALKGGIS